MKKIDGVVLDLTIIYKECLSSEMSYLMKENLPIKVPVNII